MPEEVLHGANPELVETYNGLEELFRLIHESQLDLEIQRQRLVRSFIKQSVEPTQTLIQACVDTALQEMEKVAELGGDQVPIPEPISHFFVN